MGIDLFEAWAGILRVLVTGTLAYAGLLIVLRVTGKRTLSKMNAFDLIVTVALGSALATTMLSRTTPLLEGLTGLTLLVLLQFAVTWASIRSDALQGLVKAQPAILLHRGEWQTRTMRRERVTREEILAALRQTGVAFIDSDTTVLIETDGSLSVMTGTAEGHDRPTLPRTAAAPQ
jgi:uncharacterized membrane protein YcaP (DUF421 family)